MQFAVRLSRNFLKRSYARRMFRGWRMIAVAIVLVVAGVALRGDAARSGALPVFGLSSAGFVLLLYGAGWWRQSKMIDDWIRAQGDAPVVYVLSEESVESSSAMGSTKLRWDAFAGITVTDCDTLLLFQRMGALTLPTDQVPAEAMEFLKDRFLAHGKKIEDKRRSR